jgi:hypothetical protein
MKLPPEIEEAFKEFGIWHDELNDGDCLKLYASIGLSVPQSTIPGIRLGGKYDTTNLPVLQGSVRWSA